MSQSLVIVDLDTDGLIDCAVLGQCSRIGEIAKIKWKKFLKSHILCTVTITRLHVKGE